MLQAIHLLGKPRVDRGDGPAPPPRGKKVWALLAYLLLSRVAPGRQHLADLLFPDADDPVGALRWNLSQLRRLLTPDAALGGDPVTLSLPPGTLVDVQVLTGSSWAQALRLEALDRDLLEGLFFATTPGFELWLGTERRRFAGAAASVLREAAQARLAGGDAATSAELASRLVAIQPFDENAHVLLVRCLCAAGNADAAAEHVAVCTALFERELGVRPSPALRAAATTAPQGEAHIGGRAAVVAQLEAGEAAVRAGTVEAGIEALRRAAVGARAADEPALLIRALVALGSALVHAARGSDEDGAAALHEATVLTEMVGDRSSAAVANRELGYIDFLRGRYTQARARLSQAGELAQEDDAGLAWIDIIAGAVDTDLADYAQATATLLRGLERAAGADDVRGLAYGSAFLGRAHLLLGDHAQARRHLQEALDFARADRWNSFVPLPEALLADLELRQGSHERATELFQHALALGEQLGDPCWESLGVRGLGLVAVARGDVDEGMDLLDEAPRRCRRLPDSYLWIEAYALDALCDLGVREAPHLSLPWIQELESIAAGTGMRELVIRAALQRARLGQTGALEAARAGVGTVDNPLLEGLLAGVR
jgi:DNA-binding SARP family transcriptional activator